jgi:signal transduction histidine kinase
MTLRSRLALGLTAIAVILVIPLLFAVHALRTLHQNATDLKDGEFAASLLLGRLREGLNDLRRSEMALLFVPNRESRDAMVQAVGTVAILTDSLEQYDLDTSARGIRTAVQEVASWAPAEYQAALSERKPTADSISAKHLVPAIDSAAAAVQTAEHALRVRTIDLVGETTTGIEHAQVVTVIALLAALAIAGVVAVVLTRTISRPVFELERGMRAVAAGDFEQRMRLSAARTDEFGQLAQSFETMTQQLAELDRIKAEFVSVASHELKTPINVVLGYVSLLQEGVYGPVNDKQREVLQTLEAQSQSLGRLVKQLLDVSRFEAGGAKLDPRPFQLEKLLEDLERGFHVLAVQRGVEFSVTRLPGLPAEVIWDQDRMNEVLGNLLSNAFKFTDRGGEVELTVTPVENGVQLDVRDTGAGIPSDQLAHVFDKFFQASNQSAASAAGSGLGLAIAKQIVEAHRGTITCDSTPGVGTTFTIVMPVRISARRPSGARQAVGAA